MVGGLVDCLTDSFIHSLIDIFIYLFIYLVLNYLFKRVTLHSYLNFDSIHRINIIESIPRIDRLTTYQIFCTRQLCIKAFHWLEDFLCDSKKAKKH